MRPKLVHSFIWAFVFLLLQVPAKEVANDNGSIELTVGDEPESLSGFRIDSPSTRDSPGGFNQRSHGSNLVRVPAHCIRFGAMLLLSELIFMGRLRLQAVRVFVAEEDSRSYDSFGQPLSPEMNRDPSFTTVGTFTVPGVMSPCLSFRPFFLYILSGGMHGVDVKGRLCCVAGLSERGPLHFDFGRQVVGRRFAFEVAHGTWSLSSVQLYRLSMYHAAT